MGNEYQANLEDLLWHDFSESMPKNYWQKFVKMNTMEISSKVWNLEQTLLAEAEGRVHERMEQEEQLKEAQDEVFRLRQELKNLKEKYQKLSTYHSWCGQIDGMSQ